ncbi:MAG: hypothetical protein ABL890_00860 [Candidatus Peribacteraceae bacterium]
MKPRHQTLEDYDRFLSHGGGSPEIQYRTEGMGGEVYPDPAIEIAKFEAERAEYNRQYALLIQRFGTYEEKPLGSSRQNGVYPALQVA